MAITDVYKGNEPYIFISYSHRDQNLVLPLISGLQQQGFRVWYDTGIEAGTEWPEYIAERLMGCGVMIAFLSQNALDSQNCRREIHFAIDLKKDLLVAHLEELTLSPGMRLQLGALQAIFRHACGSDEEFCRNLCNATILQSCRQKIPAPPRPEPANQPPQQPQPNRQPSQQPAEPVARPKKSNRDALLAAIAQGNEALKGDKLSFHFKRPVALKEKQIRNADFYIAKFSFDKLVALMDTTIFESGKAGYLITEDTFFYKDGLYRGEIPLLQLQSVYLQDKNHVVLTYENGYKETAFFSIYAHGFYVFFQAYLNEKQ